MEKTNEKIYLVMWESNVDGERLFDATPCRTLEAAEKKWKRTLRKFLAVGISCMQIRKIAQ